MTIEQFMVEFGKVAHLFEVNALGWIRTKDEYAYCPIEQIGRVQLGAHHIYFTVEVCASLGISAFAEILVDAADDGAGDDKEIQKVRADMLRLMGVEDIT